MSHPSDDELARLEEALNDLRRLGERRGYKRRLLAGLGTPIRPGVLRTLRAVEHAERGGCSVGEAAERLSVDASTASRLVEQAVADGYLRQDPSEQDRRRTVLTLTAEGASVLRRAASVRRALLAEATSGWKAEEVGALAELLSRLQADFDRFEERA